MIEPLADRISRLMQRGYQEIAGTTLLSIQNYFLPEMAKAADLELDRLIFLSSHAVIQTVGEKLAGKRGLGATEFYLAQFVDLPGGPDGRQYSPIAGQIHNLRNSYAHMPFSIHGYSVAIDYRIDDGWMRDGTTVHINPKIYAKDLADGFLRTYDYVENDIDPETARVLAYSYLADFLDVDGGDAIRGKIKELKKAAPPDRDPIEADIRERMTRFAATL